jgi:hypothetical protein
MIICNHPRGPAGHLELQCNETTSHKPLLYPLTHTRAESQVPIREIPSVSPFLLSLQTQEKL